MIRVEPLPQKPLLGISSCLLGEPVRYDGSDKRDAFLTEQLAMHVEFRAFCPEVGIDLGVPRPPIQLINVDGAIRLRGVHDPDRDVTEAMLAYAHRQQPLQRALSGYVLKSRSPSCGMAGITVHVANGSLPRHAAGLYAGQLQRHFPLLPVEEETRLQDPAVREHFLTRVYSYARWQALRASHPGKDDLRRFQARHSLLLRAHNEAAFRRLGRLLAEMPGQLSAAWLDAYAVAFMSTLKSQATRQRHGKVLRRIAGYLKTALDTGDQTELAATITDYCLEKVPLLAPLTLLQQHLYRHPQPDLTQQHYFAPWPVELDLYRAR